MGHGEDALQGRLPRLEGKIRRDGEAMNNIQTKHKQRNVGLDLIKILACLGVVAAHTIYPSKGCVNRIVTLLAVTSIPLFFTVNGYLMLRKEELNYKYMLKKILRILLVCFSWEFLHAVAYLIYYKRFRNFVISFVMDFFQQGLFFHFWYMGALILVYLAMPLLHKLLKKAPDIYVVVFTALIIICAGIDLSAMIVKQQFILEVPQNLRCWTWLLYAMAGGYAAMEGKAVRRFDSLNGYVKLFLTGLMLIFISVWQFWFGTKVFGSVVIEAFYGSLAALLATMSVFLLCRNVHFSKKSAGWITYCSGLIMGIYIMHPFILAVLNKYIPAFTQSGMTINLLFWIGTVVISAIGSAIVQKIPGLRQLLRL